MTAPQPLASPLHWPRGKARTPTVQRRRYARWAKSTVATASERIAYEVWVLGGLDLVLSTNLALRIDGFPRGGQPEPADSGVAVYFTRKGKQIALACDRYVRVAENLRAIGMHLEALRGQERWGVGTLDQAFAGYTALPETAGEEVWWSVLGLSGPAVDLEHLTGAYHAAAKRVHPDVGGTPEDFVRIRRAYDLGRAELGAP